MKNRKEEKIALRTAIRNGFWNDPNPLTNPWGAAPPVGADTFTTSTFIVTVNTALGAAGCAGGTITAGGTLSIQSTAGFTLTGAVAHNGTFEMVDSGNPATPTRLTLNGAITWTSIPASIWNVNGSGGSGAEQISWELLNSAKISFSNAPTITGTIKNIAVTCTGTAYFTALNNAYPGFTVTNIRFYNINSPGATGAIYNSLNVRDATFIVENIIAAYPIGGNVFTGSTNMTLNTFTAVNYAMYTPYLKDNSSATINLNVNPSTSQEVLAPVLDGNSRLTINEALGVACSGYPVYNGTVIGSSSVIVYSLYTGASKLIFYTGTISTLGTIDVTTNTTGTVNLFYSNVGFISYGTLKLTTLANLTTLNLTNTSYSSFYWQLSRSKPLKIIGTITTITHSAGPYQYEPLLYCSDETTNNIKIQYDLNYPCPNYTALYGTSAGWTAATKTLAAGGSLIINTTGHASAGMDVAISSFASFALTTTGTATINTATYQISFDGGILWSAALTAAQLQTNTYIINGNTYYTDPRYNVQLRISLASTLGGTVTSVKITGITYNPAITESWNVRWNFEQDEGVGFSTTTDSFHQISTVKIGTPISLSGGGTTLANNLINMADNAGGAAFNSATDSLHELANAIAAIAAAIAALLAPILRGVQWLQIQFRHVFGNRIK